MINKHKNKSRLLVEKNDVKKCVTIDDFEKVLSLKFSIDYNLTPRGYIFPNGKNLALDSYTSHGQVLQFLIKNGCVEEYEGIYNGGCPPLEDLGCIRTNLDSEGFVMLSVKEPTAKQYEVLLDFFDKYLNRKHQWRYSSDLMILTPHQKSDFAKISLTNKVSDDIVDIIRNYYRTGRIVESKKIENLTNIEAMYLLEREEEVLKEEKIETDRFDVFVFESPYQVKNKLLSFNESVRIFIDEKSSLYLLGLPYDTTHTEMVDVANENGFNTSIDDFNKNKLCAVFVPYGDEEYGYMAEPSLASDDYDTVYEYDNFKVYSRYQDFSKFKLASILGKYTKRKLSRKVHEELESSIDRNINEELLKTDDPKKLLKACGKYVYHATYKKHLDNIKKNGLSNFWFGIYADECLEMIEFNHGEYEEEIVIKIPTKLLNADKCDFTLDNGDGWSDNWAGTCFYRGTISSNQLLFYDVFNDDTTNNVSKSALELFRTINESLKEEKIEIEKDSQGNELTAEQSEFFKNSKVRDENNRLLVVYHGTSKQFDDETFKSPINWFTPDLDYARGFGTWTGKKGFNYQCYLSCSKIFDCGLTDGPIFDLMPIKPYKFSSRFESIFKKLNTNEKLIRNIIEEVADEYDEKANGYTMKIHVLTRSYQFKDLLSGQGYDCIRCVENGNVVTFGVFNSNQIKKIDNKTPTNSTNINESKQDEQNLIDFAGDSLAKRFLNIKKRLKSPENDIYYWLKKTPVELEDRVNEIENTTSKTKQKEIEKTEGAELVTEENGYKVYRIDTYEASCLYGKGTKWCTASTETNKHFNGYKDRGIKLYYFIKNNEKYALALYPKIVSGLNSHGIKSNFELYDAKDNLITDLNQIKSLNLPEIPGIKLTFEFLPTKIENGVLIKVYPYNQGEFVIPNNVTEIGNYAFTGCRSLKSINIPNSVTSIGYGAFYKCKSLKSINIPSSVTSIGYSAFYGCFSLTIYAEAPSKPTGWNAEWNSSNRPVVWGYKNSTNSNITRYYTGAKLEESSVDEKLSIPKYLYHATYKPFLKSIKEKGLGNTRKKMWSDSVRGVVYLATDEDVAYSYAENAEWLDDVEDYDKYADNIVILKIDTDKLDKTKFKKDSNVIDGDDTFEYHGVISFEFVEEILDKHHIVESLSGKEKEVIDTLDKYFGQKETYVWSTYILPNGHFLNPGNYKKDDAEWQSSLSYEHEDFDFVLDEFGFFNNKVLEDYCIKVNVTFPYVAMPNNRATPEQFLALRKLIDRRDEFEYSFDEISDIVENGSDVYDMTAPLIIILKNSEIAVDLDSTDGHSIVKMISRAYTTGTLLAESALNEGVKTNHFTPYTAGYILEDGSLLVMDEYHGEEEIREFYPEYSNTHPEEDTCVRLYIRPTEAQYRRLEEIIDYYLDWEGYCKVEIWEKFTGKYNFYEVYSLYEGACEDSTWNEKIGNWTGYKLVQIIKNYFAKSGY